MKTIVPVGTAHVGCVTLAIVGVGTGVAQVKKTVLELLELLESPVVLVTVAVFV